MANKVTITLKNRTSEKLILDGVHSSGEFREGPTQEIVPGDKGFSKSEGDTGIFTAPDEHGYLNYKVGDSNEVVYIKYFNPKKGNNVYEKTDSANYCVTFHGEAPDYGGTADSYMIYYVYEKYAQQNAPKNLGPKIKSDINIFPNDYLESANGQYQAIMQEDGNFCVYKVRNTERDFIWASSSNREIGPGFYAFLDKNGDINIKEGVNPSLYNDNPLIWKSDGFTTGQFKDDYSLELSDDGLLLVFLYSSGNQKTLQWASTTDSVITLLQYNTHLFYGTFAEFGVVKGIPMIYHDEDRRDKIIDMINSTNADIVTLNEVWSDGFQHIFADRLKAKFPYAAFGHKSRPTHPGAGILLLSKYEILSFDNSTVYPNQDSIAEATKGVLSAHIKGKTCEFIVSLSHTLGDTGESQTLGETSYSEEADNICTFIKSAENFRAAINKSLPIIFVGDLNIHSSKYDKMKTKFFERVQAINVWKTLNNPDPNQNTNRLGYTCNTYGNHLDQIFSPDRDVKAEEPMTNEMYTDRLDHVFVSPGITPLASGVIYNWKFVPGGIPATEILNNIALSFGYVFQGHFFDRSIILNDPNATDLSDHYPLLSILKLDGHM